MGKTAWPGLVSLHVDFFTCGNENSNLRNCIIYPFLCQYLFGVALFVPFWRRASPQMESRLRQTGSALLDIRAVVRGFLNERIDLPQAEEQVGARKEQTRLVD